MTEVANEERRSAWQPFLRSPLTLFAGIFSILQGVVLAFLSRGKNPLEPIDGLVVILLTVVLFAVIVLARPQALYPPDEWREPSHAPEARLALYALLFFILFIGGGWTMKFAGPGWAIALSKGLSCSAGATSSSNQSLGSTEALVQPLR